MWESFLQYSRIFQFSLPFSNNLNIHLTCKAFIYERVLLELLKCT
jgi:hypothetical protein